MSDHEANLSRGNLPGSERQRIAPKAKRRLEPVSRYGDIVDVAADLFSKRGYAATTIQDIADAVGILPGSLYHYIHSKEDLLFSIVEEVHSHAGDTMDAVRATDGDAVQKLATFIRWHLAPTDKDIAKARVFYSEFGQLSPERAADVQRRRDEYDRMLRAIIVEGQAEGLFAAHLDPFLTGMAIFGTLNFVTTWYHAGGALGVNEITDAFTDFVLRAVAGQHALAVSLPPTKPARKPRPQTKARSQP